MKSIMKNIALFVLDQTTQGKKIRAKFGFLKKLFSTSLLKLGFLD